MSIPPVREHVVRERMNFLRLARIDQVRNECHPLSALLHDTGRSEEYGRQTLPATAFNEEFPYRKNNHQKIRKSCLGCFFMSRRSTGSLRIPPHPYTSSTFTMINIRPGKNILICAVVQNRQACLKSKSNAEQTQRKKRN